MAVLADDLPPARSGAGSGVPALTGGGQMRRATLAVGMALVLVVPWAFVAPVAGAPAGGVAQAAATAPGEGSLDGAGASFQQAAIDQVTGSPDVELAAPQNRIRAGERTTLSVMVSNGGETGRTGPAPLMDRITTARNVKLSVQADEIDAPIQVKSGTVLLSALPTGRPATAEFALETSDDLEPGTYRIPIRVRYDYTSSVTFRTNPATGGASIVDTSDDWKSDRKYVTVVVDESPQFDVVSEQATNLYAGDTGRVNLTVRNTGEEAASDATVTLQSRSPTVYFGSPARPQANASVFPGELEPGEAYTTSVQVGASDEATSGSYPVSARVVYENENGVRGASESMSVGVAVRPERRFELRNVSAQRLRVGEDDAVVTGRIVNRGPAPARNAVVRLATGSPAPSARAGGSGKPAVSAGAQAGAASGPVQVVAPESSVGTLAPGESRPVRFRVSVADDADPGSQLFAASVEYENADGDVRQTRSPLRQSLAVGPEQPVLAVRDVNASLRSGQDGVVRVTVENTGDRPLTDANAKLFVNDPLSSSDNGAYVGRLDPGETATAVFTVSASGDTVAKEYAGTVEVRYEDASGDTELSDGHQVGIPVRSDGGGVPIPFVTAGAGVLAVSGLVFVYQRRTPGRR